MGVPVTMHCAAPGCTATGCSTSGVTFTAAECFTKALPNAPQLWACCVQHKRECLYSILKDLPYRTSKRGSSAPRQQPQQQQPQQPHQAAAAVRLEDHTALYAAGLRR